MEKEDVSIQELKTRTDEFLGWVEERKMNGFKGREIDNLRTILEESLERETFGDTVEHVKRSVRKWIAEWWSPTKIGQKYEKHQNKTSRAEVIRQFPQMLQGFLDTLSNIDQYELNEVEQSVFTEITQRIQESIMALELTGGDEKVQPEKDRKKRRSKPPRGDR